jgi:RNA polymerase-binding transcription factor DksA
MRVMSTFEWQRHSQLLELRDHLQEMMVGLRSAAMSRGDYEPHDVSDDEAALQADVIEARIARVDGAIGRLQSGAYGVCQDCAAPISAARLEALPATPVCRDCA